MKTPPISRIVNHGREFVRFESDCERCSDHAIQAAALEKILTSDFVYVVNPGGYTGRATAYELGRIHERGIAVYYCDNRARTRTRSAIPEAGSSRPSSWRSCRIFPR